MEQDEIMHKRDYQVIKSNSLIQKTRYSLSTQEQKIVLYLISKLKPNDDELMLYEFDTKEFCQVCGLSDQSGKHYTSLKQTIKNLSDKSFWITLEDGTETLLRWIEKPYIQPKNGVIQIKFDQDMKPYFLELKEHFTQYHLYYILAMRSQYSIRLYELLKSYEFRQSIRFGLDNLKNKINAETYHRYPDFKRKVLDIAIREINEYSDIYIQYELKKTGRKVTEVLFRINPKRNLEDRVETWTRIEKKLSPKQLQGQLSLLTSTAGE